MSTVYQYSQPPAGDSTGKVPADPSFRKKLIFLAVAAFMAVIAVVFTSIASKTSTPQSQTQAPQEVAVQIISAIKEKDVEEVKSLLADESPGKSSNNETLTMFAEKQAASFKECGYSAATSVTAYDNKEAPKVAVVKLLCTDGSTFSKVTLYKNSSDQWKVYLVA